MKLSITLVDSGEVGGGSGKLSTNNPFLICCQKFCFIH